MKVFVISCFLEIVHLQRITQNLRRIFRQYETYINKQQSIARNEVFLSLLSTAPLIPPQTSNYSQRRKPTVPKILWSAGANKSARDSRPHANRNCRAEIGRANKGRRRKIPLPSKTQLFVRETFTGSILCLPASRTVSILDDEESWHRMIFA